MRIEEYVKDHKPGMVHIKSVAIGAAIPLCLLFAAIVTIPNTNWRLTNEPDVMFKMHYTDRVLQKLAVSVPTGVEVEIREVVFQRHEGVTTFDTSE